MMIRINLVIALTCLICPDSIAQMLISCNQNSTADRSKQTEEWVPVQPTSPYLIMFFFENDFRQLEIVSMSGETTVEIKSFKKSDTSKSFTVTGKGLGSGLDTLYFDLERKEVIWLIGGGDPNVALWYNIDFWNKYLK